MTDPLAPLRARFRARAAADLVQLRRLRTAGVDAASLHGMAHNLSGAAGMFGYPALSAAARVIDDACRAGQPPAADQLDALERALADTAAARP